MTELNLISGLETRRASAFRFDGESRHPARTTGWILSRGFAGLVLAGLVLAAPRVGFAIEICHTNQHGAPNGPAWSLIHVGSEAAADMHIQLHGDGVPGGAVPGMEVFAFDHRCEMVFAVLQDSVPYTCASGAVAYEILYVRNGHELPEEGTRERPFRSLSSALAFAELAGLGAVELQVAPGTYGAESLTISRHTRIVGPGTQAADPVDLAVAVDNHGAHTVGIQGLMFAANAFEPALTVNNGNAETQLCDVAFDGVSGHAVAQHGGTLQAAEISVMGTQRDPGAGPNDSDSGTGIRLSGGAIASLAQIELVGSEGAGLHAQGAGTSVYIDWFGSTDSIVTGGMGCAAVHVADGASVYANGLAVDTNQGTGVLVAGTGSQIDMPRLLATHALAPDADRCGTNVGIGLRVIDDPVVSINGTETDPFLISDAVVGIVFDGSGVPQLGLSYGIVSNHSVGVSISRDSAEEFAAIFDQLTSDCGSGLGSTVLYINNGINIDLPFIPIPEPCGDPDDL